MQDGPTSQPPRVVTVGINGISAGAITLDTALREYTFEGYLPAPTWITERALRIDLQTTPLLIPNDARPLGIIVAQPTIAPIEPAWPLLFAPNLLLLALTYTTLRFVGASIIGAASSLGVPLALYAVLAQANYPTAVHLAYAALHRPLGMLGVILFLVAGGLLAHALPQWAHVRILGSLGVSPLPASLGIAVGLFLVLRALFSLFALALSLRLPLPPPCHAGLSIPVRHTGGPGFGLMGVWERWDACWYEHIATVGYQPQGRGVAFFPLYPLLMRIVSVPLLGDLTLSGLFVSGLAYIAAMIGLYRLVSRDFDQSVAQWTVLYLSVFPVAFYLFAPFTEALFLAFAVWTIYMARQGAWAWASLAALLASLTRTQGVLLALPLAWEVWRYWRNATSKRERPVALALVPLVPFIGLTAFSAYSRIVTGSIPFQIQGAWQTAFHLPWTVVALSWQRIRAQADVLQAVNLGSLLLFTLILVAGLRRLPLTYSFYALPQLLLIGTRTGYSILPSTSRYLLVIFPAFVILGLLGRRRLIHAIWLVTSLWLLAILLYAFLYGVPIA